MDNPWITLCAHGCTHVDNLWITVDNVDNSPILGPCSVAAESYPRLGSPCLRSVSEMEGHVCGDMNTIMHVHIAASPVPDQAQKCVVITVKSVSNQFL